MPTGHACQCLPGYRGDGYTCEPETGPDGGYEHPPFSNQGPFYPPEEEPKQPDEYAPLPFQPIYPEPVTTLRPYDSHQDADQSFNPDYLEVCSFF